MIHARRWKTHRSASAGRSECITMWISTSLDFEPLFEPDIRIVTSFTILNSPVDITTYDDYDRMCVTINWQTKGRKWLSPSPSCSKSTLVGKIGRKTISVNIFIVRFRLDKQLCFQIFLVSFWPSVKKHRFNFYCYTLEQPQICSQKKWFSFFPEIGFKRDKIHTRTMSWFKPNK